MQGQLLRDLGLAVGLLAFSAISAVAEDDGPDCGYPATERRAGIEGTVVLAITVGADGVVNDAQVLQSSGNSELDRVAAVCAKAKWRYKPATKEGVPVESHTNATVVWKLPR